ncbi:MAG: phosphatidate cytidylyltransferase, partial [Promethearchaeota archaeon]
RLVLAPHVYLTVGVFFTVILSSGIDLFLGENTGISAQIVAITVMVSALADAVATIVGITKGKHHLKGGKSKKTWEGWIAGVASSILLGFVSFLVLMPQFGGTVMQGIVLTLVAAGIFGLTDYFSPRISDNILNPVLISLALWGVALLVFI